MSFRIINFLAVASILVTILSERECASEVQNPANLPRVNIESLQFQGVFRVPAHVFGESEMNFSEGPIAYNPRNHSVFLVGHSHHQAIAEFTIPGFSKSDDLDELPMSSGPKQAFHSILNKTQDGNPQQIDRIGGMTLIDGKLLVNAYEYYDAPADNTHTSLIVQNPESVGSSPIEGFISFAGGAGHTSGWLSPVPPEWHQNLGGSYLTGQSSGIPIIGRTSVGPSAFAFDPSFLEQNAPSRLVETTPLQDFSLENPLHADLSNDSRQNNLWTHLSRVVYGFIIPGTRTYLTIGYSGGHRSGVCYKCTQNDGNTCGGYCAREAEDYYPYYWLWDVSEWLSVLKGEREPYSIRPYDSGIFETPYPVREIGGGTFDPASNTLYLTLQRGDTGQGTYANPPLIASYTIAVTSSPDDPEGPNEQFLGRFRANRYMCVRTPSGSQVRIVNSKSQGKLVSVQKASWMLRRNIRQLRTLVSPQTVARKRRNLTKLLSNVRKCG